ncbi:MAG: hypothetical protein LBK58_07210, partial [Prevotellaceae bacterium]|nr:hypothetical protein [Prevotellaceae bacterium]
VISPTQAMGTPISVGLCALITLPPWLVESPKRMTPLPFFFQGHKKFLVCSGCMVLGQALSFCGKTSSYRIGRFTGFGPKYFSASAASNSKKPHGSDNTGWLNISATRGWTNNNI